jgi:competence protein ComEA
MVCNRVLEGRAVDTMDHRPIHADVTGDPWLEHSIDNHFSVVGTVDEVTDVLPTQGGSVRPSHRRLLLRWFTVHRVWTIGLFVAGICFGYLLHPFAAIHAVGTSGTVASSSGAATKSVTTTTAQTHTSTIVVDVKGDVQKPGVYHLSTAARVSNAIQAAGGFRHSGDAALVNLAAPVDDGAEVIVPVASGSGSTASRGASASASDTRASGSNSGAASSPPVDASVDVNTADESSLETLPGIGPAKAAAIVKYRTTNGPFQTVNDLAQVPGIGAGTLAKLKPYIMVPGNKPS